jgi:ribosome production factor 1
MPPSRFEASSIKNKLKREEVSRKSKKAKSQQKLQKRLALAKLEANDPAAKKVRRNDIASSGNCLRSCLQ